MKKISTLLAGVLLFTAVIQAQDINKLFKKYAHDEQFEYVSVGSLLMKFAKLFVPNSEYEHLTARMKGVKILTLNQTAENTALFADFRDELNKLTEHQRFDALMVTRSKGEKTNIYRRVTKKNNADVVIVSQNKQEINVIWFNGKATKEELDKIFKNESTADNDSIELEK